MNIYFTANLNPASFLILWGGNEQQGGLGDSTTHPMVDEDCEGGASAIARKAEVEDPRNE